MTKIFTLSAFILITSAPAYACQISMAPITATVVGSTIEKGVCKVDVIIDSIEKNAPCLLRGIKVGQEIRVAVEKELLNEGRCPDDEGYTLKGTIARVQGEYTLFNGSVE